MGVNLDKRYGVSGSEVYTFRVQGRIYHKVDQLVPRDGEPRYLQLYFYDPESEFEHRLKWPNLDRKIVTILSRVLAPNPYVQTFRSLGNIGPLDKYRVKLTTSFKEDQRLYNRLTTSEVAGIWVEGNENITTYKRSIVVYGRSKYPTHIQAYFACYDPLSYSMLFPNGEAGWHKRITRTCVDIREHINDDDDDGIEAKKGEPKKCHWNYPRHSQETTRQGVTRTYCIDRETMPLRSLSDFDLPNITTDVRPYAFGCREKNAYDTIMQHVDADSSGVFFIDGLGGTGKTFLYKALLANVRSRGLIALATASSDPENGLCNGTRLICKRFDPNAINAEIVVEQRAGVRVLLPRIPLAAYEEDMFPFKLNRTQFPIRISFAMTINKAQGQTIPNVDVYLPEYVFSHGQLYVALSRGISRTTTNVLMKPEKEVDRPGVYTLNVVYQEVLRDD
nr:hypothetical protein [Tanacetum cinerariifolium]